MPSPSDTSSSAPPPRAFAQGTGVVLQTVGMVFLLATCCVCSMTFLWDPAPPRGAVQNPVPQSLAESFSAMLADPGRSGLMLTIVALNVGGLSLAVFGLGLQSEKRRAAWGATITIVLLTVALLVAGVGLWWGEATLHARFWHALVMLLTLALWPFIIVALRQVITHPPPADVEVLPPDFKIPYSMYHDDPPDVRLARDIARRRTKLEAERAELDRLEQELRDKQD